MEEKILIQSKPSKKTKLFFLYVSITLFVFSIIFFLLYLNRDSIAGQPGTALIILQSVFLFMSAMVFLTFLLLPCNLTISKNFIEGTTLWGKKIDLPIHMVSAYSTSEIFSTIAIYTSSARIKFLGIGNYKDIDDVLKNLLTERQKKTEVQAATSTSQSDTKSLGDLVALKNLLDNGIITQEEFNLKKKEILNL